MAFSKTLLALGLIAAAAPISTAAEERTVMTTAPAGTSETRYCMRIEALTGSRIERVKCWTRAKWANQGVDVDRDWPEEGVRVIG